MHYARARACSWRHRRLPNDRGRALVRGAGTEGREPPRRKDKAEQGRARSWGRRGGRAAGRPGLVLLLRRAALPLAPRDVVFVAEREETLLQLGVRRVQLLAP